VALQTCDQEWGQGTDVDKNSSAVRTAVEGEEHA
jgi:hypothetical protein